MESKQSKWHPPPVGFVKLNFYGCFLGNPAKLRNGGVIRDHSFEGLFQTCKRVFGHQGKDPSDVRCQGKASSPSNL